MIVPLSLISPPKRTSLFGQPLRGVTLIGFGAATSVPTRKRPDVFHDLIRDIENVLPRPLMTGQLLVGDAMDRINGAVK